MSKITFSPPKEYTVPEGIAEGDTFDTSVTLKLEKGGKLCLTAIDGIPMPGYEEESAKGRKPNEVDSAAQADFAQRYETAMQAAPTMPPQ